MENIILRLGLQIYKKLSGNSLLNALDSLIWKNYSLILNALVFPLIFVNISNVSFLVHFKNSSKKKWRKADKRLERSFGKGPGRPVKALALVESLQKGPLSRQAFRLSRKCIFKLEPKIDI